MAKNTEYQKITKDCDLKIDERKSEFNQMKRDLQVIAELETEIKANLDQAG